MFLYKNLSSPKYITPMWNILERRIVPLNKMKHFSLAGKHFDVIKNQNYYKKSQIPYLYIFYDC